MSVVDETRHQSNPNVGAAAEIVVERLGADAFLAGWGALYALQTSPSFFLTSEWMESWIEGRPRDAGLLMLRAQRGDSMLGLAAFGVPSHAPIIGRRTARLQEWGETQRDAVYIEDNDALLAPDAGPEVYDAFFSHAAACSAADEIIVRNATPRCAAAAQAFGHGAAWRATTHKTLPTFSVDLETLRAGGMRYLDSRSNGLRAKVQRALRRYKERGPVTLSTAPADDAAALATLTRLHNESWARRGEAGAFGNPEFVAFHQRLRAKAAASIEILELRVGDDIVASLYNFVHEGRALNYQSGVGIETDNQLTPGLLAHALAAQCYLERGFKSYELLAGDADYKRRLADESGALMTIVLERRGWRLAARDALKRLVRAGKRQT